MAGVARRVEAGGEGRALDHERHGFVAERRAGDAPTAHTAKDWSGLVRFLEDARIPLSNNHTERAERGPVVGRKNFGGCKSERGLQVAALFYSLLGSAKLAGVEPKAYLRTMAYAAIRGEALVLPHEVARDARFRDIAANRSSPEDSPQASRKDEYARQLSEKSTG